MAKMPADRYQRMMQTRLVNRIVKIENAREESRRLDRNTKQRARRTAKQAK